MDENIRIEMEMINLKLVALPCLCVDVFDGTNEIRPGGEALNFAAHASEFNGIDVTLLGVIGNDEFGDVIMKSIVDKKIDTKYVRIDEKHATANNRTYLTPDGDRYYKEDSWNGEILEHFMLNDTEIKVIDESDVVFVHFFSSCFRQIVDLKKRFDFKLAVDFDVYRDFENMKEYAPYIDFFMISGTEELLPIFEEFSESFNGLFNISLGEQGSVTYHKCMKYQIPAKKVDEVIDTTGCGDSYHAGFVCSYLLEGDIEKAMMVGSEIAANVLGQYGGF